MKVEVRSRSGRSFGIFELPDDATLAALQTPFHVANPKYYPDRQRFYPSTSSPASTSSTSSTTTTTTATTTTATTATATATATASPSPPLSSSQRVPALSADAPLADGAVLVFKDLGPQILWKTVFLIEYLGPLLLYPLFYMQPRWIYGSATLDAAASAPKFVHEVQFSAMIAWSFHYAKRELETLFVHRFSHATMPLANLFKNCSYYWGFAAFVAYFVNHPLYTPPPEDLVYTGMCLFYFMEIGNLSAHWTLRMLRPPGTKVRRIPRGGLFEFVSCPNYTYEILSWLGFNLMTRTVAGIAFMCFGAAQMLLWAQAKHRRYRAEFDGKDGRPLYPPNRKIIVPFLY